MNGAAVYAGAEKKPPCRVALIRCSERLCYFLATTNRMTAIAIPMTQ